MFDRRIRSTDSSAAQATDWSSISFNYWMFYQTFQILDNLVLSTGLIMWISHGKEIQKLTFRALAFRRSDTCLLVRVCSLTPSSDLNKKNDTQFQTSKIDYGYNMWLQLTRSSSHFCKHLRRATSLHTKMVKLYAHFQTKVVTVLYFFLSSSKGSVIRKPAEFNCSGHLSRGRIEEALCQNGYLATGAFNAWVLSIVE